MGLPVVIRVCQIQRNLHQGYTDLLKYWKQGRTSVQVRNNTLLENTRNVACVSVGAKLTVRIASQRTTLTRP